MSFSRFFSGGARVSGPLAAHGSTLGYAGFIPYDTWWGVNNYWVDGECPCHS